MKQVRCVSPHGGCHNGMFHDGRPVFAMPDGKIPEPDPEKLRLPANPGGYITDVRLPGRFAAVGEVYDVPDDFEADGFHWEDVEAPPPPPPPPAGKPAAEGK
jgi:hypothetical protein